MDENHGHILTVQDHNVQYTSQIYKQIIGIKKTNIVDSILDFRVIK